jgi:hypothetical protein
VIYKVRRAAEDEIEECEQLFARFFPGCIKPRQDSVWRVAWAKRQGCPHAVTYTATDNATSANSLIACGFKQLELDKPWFPNCAHCESAGFVYWRRSLGA